MAMIRLWKLGSLEKEIYPTPEAAEKLRDILETMFKNDDGTTQDLIWGPDIECILIDDGKDIILGEKK